MGLTALALGQKAKDNTEASLRREQANAGQWVGDNFGAPTLDFLGPLGAATSSKRPTIDTRGVEQFLQNLQNGGAPKIPVGRITGKGTGASLLPGPGGWGQPTPDFTDRFTQWGVPTGEDAWRSLQQAAQQAGSVAQGAGDVVANSKIPSIAQMLTGQTREGMGEAAAQKAQDAADQIGGGLDQFRQDVQSDPGGALQSLIDAAGGVVGGGLDWLNAARNQVKSPSSTDIGMPWNEKAQRDGVPAADATAANLTKFPNTAWPDVSILVNPAGGKYGALDENGQFVTFADAANLTDEQNKAVHMQRLDEIEAAIVKQGGTGGVAPPTGGEAPVIIGGPDPVTPVGTGNGGGTGGGTGGGGTTTYPSSGGGGGTYPSSGGSSGGGTYHRSYGGSSGGYSRSGGYSSSRKKRKKGTTGSMGSGGGMWPGFPFNRPNSPMRQHILDAIAASMNKNKGR
jgi:hypothetical protein